MIQRMIISLNKGYGPVNSIALAVFGYYKYFLTILISISSNKTYTDLKVFNFLDEREFINV